MNRLKLTIRKIDRTCDFELSWAKNRSLTARLEYPQSLLDCYQKWRIAYLNYYKNNKSRIKITGIVIDFPEPDRDWHRVLRDAELELRTEFDRWLYNYELASIRQEIITKIEQNNPRELHLLIACSTKELTHLPWETWNIGSELSNKGKVYIARTTINNPHGKRSSNRLRKPRILAIIGRDSNLDFSQDQKTIQSLDRLADITILERDIDDDNHQFSRQVFDTIISSDGWDILFFIGHSNEASYGGELHLSPNTSLKMEDLKESLNIAAKNGLQLAIFNSCSGIDIAEYLIELGLNQVVVMREPIENKVASEFLQELIYYLVRYQNIQVAIANFYHLFERENLQHTYPSAYLIPSLYCHTEAKLFGFKDWQKDLKKWLPSKRYARSLLVLILLSLFPPVGDLLLETRLFTQLIYRRVTRQVNREEIIQSPPTLLVQIDEESLTKANLPWQSRNEIDRIYLAKLIQSLSERDLKPKVIGIDYKLWEPKPFEDAILQQAIEQGRRNNTQFVFAASNGDKKAIIPQIADPQTSLHGDIYFYPGYLEIPTRDRDCSEFFPFAYLLALVKTQQLDGTYFTSDRTIQNIKFQSNLDRSNFVEQIKLNFLASFTQNFFPTWFHPILDFSLPPDRMYGKIPAWCLLSDRSSTSSVCQPLDDLQQQIIIIAAGGYEEADDNFPMPISLQLIGNNQNSTSTYLTGGEIHGYTIHHILNRHLIAPIPDILVILPFAIFAQGTVLYLLPSKRKKRIKLIAIGNFAYAIICWQLYISLKILIPVLLPSVLLWRYIWIGKYNTV